ncbi:protein adenylyltransferase SelO [Corynebacterium sp. H113]|uniref:protein adenylyltransferase SelO n=1 Tax=Corynebacterium sp. H113 TaxID=3133419 RepID=UPI00309DA790
MMPSLTMSIAAALPELAVPTTGDAVPRPSVLALNDDLARQLGFDPTWLRSEEGISFLIGRGTPQADTTRQAEATMQPVALAYAGHQFGQYSPVLGDGRALLLGEVIAPAGLTFPDRLNPTEQDHSDEQHQQTYDIHAKGTGRNVFSRGGDGKCTVMAALREYLMSEAMYALGIPTTRALAVISTGELVQRNLTPAFPGQATGSTDSPTAVDPIQPGAIIVRVASSHVRVGTFELVRTADTALLERLLDYTVDRHRIHDSNPTDNSTTETSQNAKALLEYVVKQQAELVAQWMATGFVHGVMNTDNCTISGETIDFGPCAFLDTHDIQAVFSSVDVGGRYAFGAQPSIAGWNCGRLAESLLPLMDLDAAQAIINSFGDYFSTAISRHWLPKIGLPATALDDDSAVALLRQWQGLLAEDQPDHTNAHVTLMRDPAGLPEGFAEWVRSWREYRRAHGITDAESEELMAHHNPIVIPRNHVVNEALVAASNEVAGALSDDAEAGNNETESPVTCELKQFFALYDAVTRPYEDPAPQYSAFIQGPPPELGDFTSYCGT